ncbi:MAG: energy transducer TonB [Chitinivibrionales bacterium]|nr:energy transducer TonB [Chitinivibrionales bacterium]
MKFKVIIKRCDDPQRASRLADEIARWSGNVKDTVLRALMKNDICIRKAADENEAYELKKRFGSLGALIELVQVNDVSPIPQEVAPRGRASYDDDDDDDGYGPPGRILTEKEFIAKARQREDIFRIDRERHIRNIQVVSLLVGIGLCTWMTSLEVVKVGTDFYEKLPEERIATLVKQLPETLEKENLDKKKEQEKEELKTEKKELKPNKYKGAGGQTGGGGDPRARVTKKGVLGIISGQIKGKTVASADIFGKGGFAAGIDAVLSGVGGLASGGGGGVGRKGAAGIGYGAGYGSGFGGGSGGIDDLLGSLMGGGGELGLKKRGSLSISQPEFTKGGALTGGRSRASIMRVVMQNLAALRYAYNQRLRDKPGLKGRITVKFAIDEFGKVIFCSVVSSTMSDPPLEATVVEKIKRWVFEKIDKPGDVTEVVYPFVFSQ